MGFKHSAALGDEGAPFVIEGDEYDTAFFDKRAKFFHYLPYIAIVTSIEFDHGDIYPDLDAIDLAFQRMLRQVPSNGWLLACADNRAAELRAHAFSQVATYGFNEDADWRGELREAADRVPRLRVMHRAECWCEAEPAVTGRHNLQNALAAAATAALLGAEPDAVAEALRTFQGVRRRLEVFLEAAGITFVDDFAHHPTAIRETVAAARARWPEARLHVLFEPRSNTTVTNRFRDDLTAAFRAADSVFLGPIYRAERILDDERLDRQVVVEGLARQGVEARYTDDVAEIVAHVQDTARAGDVVLVLSNGAFGGIYDRFRAAYAAP